MREILGDLRTGLWRRRWPCVRKFKALLDETKAAENGPLANPSSVSVSLVEDVVFVGAALIVVDVKDDCFAGLDAARMLISGPAAGLATFRKSIYATVGESGVFRRLSSVLIATNGE